MCITSLVQHELNKRFCKKVTMKSQKAEQQKKKGVIVALRFLRRCLSVYCQATQRNWTQQVENGMLFSNTVL